MPSWTPLSFLTSCHTCSRGEVAAAVSGQPNRRVRSRNEPTWSMCLALNFFLTPRLCREAPFLLVPVFLLFPDAIFVH